MSPLYPRQDARVGFLDLETYDASVMMADLGDQRLKNLPLRGRIVYQTEAQATSKSGIQNEAISKWKDYHGKEAEELGKSLTEDIEPDGLGLGGSYRKGPNYRPVRSTKFNPPRPRAGGYIPSPPYQRRSVSLASPPLGGLLGPRPINPSVRVMRSQLVTRHLNMKPLAGFEGRSNAASCIIPHHTPQAAIASNKWTSGKLVSPGTQIPPSLLNFNGITPKFHETQPAPNTSPLKTMTIPSTGVVPYHPQAKPVGMQSTSASADTSRSASRSSSAVRSETTIPSTVGPPRASFRSTALPIKSPPVRDTIRTVPEASKNHWNKMALHQEISNALPNTALPKSAPIPKAISNVEERCMTTSPDQDNKEVPTVNVGMEVLNSAKTKYGGLAASKYASAAPNDHFSSKKHHTSSTTQQPSGLLVGSTPSGLSASKHAITIPSASKYAPPVSSSLSASKYANVIPPGPYTHKSSVPTVLSNTKTTANPSNSMSSSRYSTAQTTSGEDVAVTEDMRKLKDSNPTNTKGIVNNLEQEPMQPSQRLFDSIAARYRFATPKQVAGLARRSRIRGRDASLQAPVYSGA